MKIYYNALKKSKHHLSLVLSLLIWELSLRLPRDRIENNLCISEDLELNVKVVETLKATGNCNLNI